MLEQAPTPNNEPFKRVDERLANLRVLRERPDVELAGRDREVERLAILVRERQVDTRLELVDL